MTRSVWAIAAELRSLLLPPGIYLAIFGSYAQGRETSISDLDLWLDGPEPETDLASSLILQGIDTLDIPKPVHITRAPTGTLFHAAMLWTVARFGIPVVGRQPDSIPSLSWEEADELWHAALGELRGVRASTSEMNCFGTKGWQGHGEGHDRVNVCKFGRD